MFTISFLSFSSRFTKKPFRKISPWIFSLIFFIFLTLVGVAVFQFYYRDKIYPHVSVSGVQVGGLTKQSAIEKLRSQKYPETMHLQANGQDFSFTYNEAGIQYDLDKTTQKAFYVGRAGTLINQLKDEFETISTNRDLPYSYAANTDFIDNKLDDITRQLSIPAVDPEISIQNKEVIVSTGKNGQDVDITQLKKQIFLNLAYAKDTEIHIPIIQLTPRISDYQSQEIKQKAGNLVGKQIKLTFEDQTFIYKDSDLLSLLQPLQPNFNLNPDKAKNLASQISQTLNRDPQNAKLTVEQGQVKEFLPAKDGVVVQENDLITKIDESILDLETNTSKEASIQIPATTSKPEVSTSEVNNLGIKELIGRGESFYKGSIPSRIHNLSLAASRLNGILIKPGEEFSFNKAIGEVSQLTGYEQAYVIKQGHTVLDDGGGVCQVSTTFFRVALNSGLPILERHQHSYRVSYYEQSTKLGIDAAIYQPSVDLRIKNDTPANILIVTKNDTKNSHLVFEFYGTSDGRQTEINNVRSWDPVPAPPDLYQDDPTLPVGQIKQIEHSIPGVKAAFDYKVTRGEEVLQNRTFYSNYQAWQAVYLRGTATQ